MQKTNPITKEKKPQSQPRPGIQKEMEPVPLSEPGRQHGKMENKILLITGGDSGIGKACAILFAKEGADVAVVYLNEHEDAEDTRKKVEAFGKKCLLISGDIRKERFCNDSVNKTIKAFGRIDVLINNAAFQFESESLEDVTTQNLMTTFETNIFSMFWITKAALPYMKKGSSIVNTTSVTAYRGSPKLIDYASTKGAIVAFTRSLSDNLVSKGIRVNAVAPGPIWTPLIVSSFPPKKTAQHGKDSPMKRPGEPNEVAPSYLFLASNEDSGYMSGQVLHPNGGEVVNG
jgi:NAD(P)-dependent dehydrogenase (short-subunit alcohol dehydrogenase family)